MIDYYQDQLIKRKKRRKVKVFAALIFFVLAAMIGGTVYLLHSPYSRIEKISVVIDSQSSLLEADTLKAYKLSLNENSSFFSEKFFGKDSIFLSFFNGGEISKFIENTIPQIAGVHIKTDIFSRTVIIEGVARSKFGLWCFESNQSASSTEASPTAGSECFWFDRVGTAFLEGPSTEGQLIYKVIDAYSNPVKLGQKLLDQNSIDNITAMFDFLENSGLEYKTLYLSEPKIEEVHTDLSVTPVIYFSLRNNPTYALKAFLESKPKLIKSGYIDLRVSNRIYYK
jgi:hypothetical protein